MYSNDITNQPNPRIPYFKQYEIVPNGTYLVTRIFRPNKYPSATLITVSFRVSIPEDTWNELRAKLFAEIQKGKTLVIEAHSGRWRLDTSESFPGHTYFRDDYGVSLKYDKPEDCFIPEKSLEEAPKMSELDDIPF